MRVGVRVGGVGVSVWGRVGFTVAVSVSVNGAVSRALRVGVGVQE